MDDQTNIPDMALHWKRPAEVPVPKVWHKFETRREKKLVSYKMKIQDIPEDRYFEVGEFINKFYINDEPLCASSNLALDGPSLEIFRYIMLTIILPQCLSIMAVLDENTEKPTIVGVQLLTVASKNDTPLPHIPTDSLSKMTRMYHDIRSNSDPFDILQSDTFLHEWGLCVHPDYRSMGVGYNIMYSLQFIAKTFNVPGTMIMFTRKESQAIAQKLEFKLYNEIVYDEYVSEDGDRIFPVKGTRSLKFMGKKFE